MRSASSSAASASSSTDSGCEATTSSASTVRASRSTGLAVIRRSGRSIPLSSPRPARRDANRRERRGLLERDLARRAAAPAARGRRRPARSATCPPPPRRSRRPCAARSTARKRSRNCATGGKRSSRCASETAGGSSASARSATTSASGSCGASRRSDARRERRGPEPEEAVALGLQPLGQPGRGLLRAPVLGEPARQLLGRLLGLELRQLGLLVREEPARLQLQQRRDEHEELAARLEVELVPLGEPLDEREHDPGHVDLGEVELLLQHERQEQVERALEGVEVQLELAHDHARNASGRAGRGPWGSPSPAPRAHAAARGGGRSAAGRPRRRGGTATR